MRGLREHRRAPTPPCIQLSAVERLRRNLSDSGDALTRLAVLALAAAPLLAASAPSANASHDTLTGTWQEPGGSVVDVVKCGDALCVRIAGIAKSEPYTTDGLNPDPALRKRPLCGLEIGKGFQRKDDAHAEKGTLYDPKSGKTYKGSMSGTGDTMTLRGYVGFRAFGRSESWTRVATGSGSCPKT